MHLIGIITAAVSMLLVMVTPSLAVNWATAIKKVEEASSGYFEYVRNKGGDTWVGAAYNGYEYDRHQCPIVGRMLGLQDAIVELETMPYPPMDGSVKDQDLLVFATSLDSWVAAAKRAIDLDDAGLRNVWNLDCVGHLGISTKHYIGNFKQRRSSSSNGPRSAFMVTSTRASSVASN